MLLALIASVALQAQAKETVSNFSTNPSAAQFRDVRTAGDVICGEVNLPNREGGFNGFQPFAYRSDKELAIRWVLDYKLIVDGQFVDTRDMRERARRLHYEDLDREIAMTHEADAWRRRGDALFAAC
jgi:hypothetical protein